MHDCLSRYFFHQRTNFFPPAFDSRSLWNQRTVYTVVAGTTAAYLVIIIIGDRYSLARVRIRVGGATDYTKYALTVGAVNTCN